MPNSAKSWAETQDNIALFHVTTYEEWLRIVGKKTQHDSQSRKSGTRTDVAEPNEKLAESIWKIYNETPIRQERGF